MKKFFKILVMATVALFAVLSCKKENQEVALTGITLDQATLNLQVGAEATLVVKFQPENVTNKPAVTWESSDAAVATVAEGKVKAVAAGTATITAKADKFSATCAVTVTGGEEPGPDYSDWDGAWGVIGDFNGWADDVEMTKGADGWYTAEVTIEGGTLEFKFRRDKTWGDYEFGIEGETELDKELALTPKKGNLKVPKAGVYTMMLKPTAALGKIVFVKDIAPAGPVAIDGNPAEWANLDAAYVASAVCAESAELKGIKSVKAYYDDKLYMLVEVSDEALAKGVADGKLRFHLFFNSDYSADGGYNSHWTLLNINYATEGKMTSGGSYCAYSSKLYAIAPGTAWATSDSGFSPVFESAGDGNFYELSMELDGFPGGLASTIGLGFDVADGNYACLGFMPNGGEELLSVVKKGTTPLDPPEVPDTFDYTPSAEYLSADNVWKPADENHSITWYYNPNWAGELAAPETSFKESTYTVKLAEADEAMEWTTQMKIIPTADLLLDTQKKYTFSCKVHSTTGTHVFIKMYQNGVDWPESFETPAGASRIEIAAGETKEITVEDFVPLATPQMLLIDFANHAANNTIHVKDIVVKVTGEVAPPDPVVEWDFTPGADYQASNNLWKPIFDGNLESYYYYHCEGTAWNGQDILTNEVPFLTKNQSTYVLNYAAETGAAWQNQFFIYPAEGHFLPLAADKTYKLKVTMGTNQPTAPGFIKFSQYDAANAKREGACIHEIGNLTLEGAHPAVIEFPEITGVECANIMFVMDFGGNPAETEIYIKDITLVEVAPPVPTPTDFVKLDDDTEAEFEGIVAVVAKNGIVVTDGTTNVYVFKPKGESVRGDKVHVKGTKTTYYGLIETKQNAEVTVLSSGNDVPLTPVVDITANFDDYPNNATTSDFVKVAGTVAVSGNYVNFKVEGATARQGSLQGLDVKDYDGKEVVLEGYYVGTGGNNGIYVYIAVTSVKEVSSAGGSGVPDYDPITGFEW